MGAAVPGEEAELAVGGVAGGGAGAGGGKQGGIVTSPPAPGRYEAYGVCSGDITSTLNHLYCVYLGVCQEAGEGVAEGGEGRGGQPGLHHPGQPRHRPQPAQLVVVQPQPRRLHLLLPPPLGPPVLEPDLNTKMGYDL